MNIEGVLDLLVLAKNNLSHADYVKIWGEELGNHIWRQEGSDLLKIWGSGLTNEQKKAFVDYLIFGNMTKEKTTKECYNDGCARYVKKDLEKDGVNGECNTSRPLSRLSNCLMFQKKEGE